MVHKKCSVEGCDKFAINSGFCVSHGAILKQCSVEGCNNKAVKGGICIKHGATVEYKKCLVDGCNKQAQKGDICIAHGAKVITKKCLVKECNNHVKKGGVCVKHGAQVKRCLVEGCNNKSVKDGTCKKHHPHYIPKQKISKGEQQIINLLEKLYVPYVYDQSFANLKGVNGGALRFDFRIPSGKLGYLFIEFDGQQHYKPVKTFGGQKTFEDTQANDLIKNIFCAHNNYPLLRIKWNQTKELEHLVIQFIKDHSNLID